MEKYFIYTIDSEIFTGEVINLAENVKDAEIIERIINFDPYLCIPGDKTKKKVELTEKTWNISDLVVDWTANDLVNEDLLIVETALDESEKFNLTSEVVYYALKYMKENSNLSIAQAIKLGFNEWIK